MHDGKWVNLHIKLQYRCPDARIDALQATKKHEVRDSKVSGTIFIYPLTWLRRNILDLIWWWKSCSTSAIWHVLRYSVDTDTQDTSVEVETWHVSRVSLSQRCLWHWHLVPSRTVLFSYVFGDICRCGAKLEDVWRYLYTYFIHDAYRWLLATSWIFVLRGGRFPPWNSLSASNLQNYNLESMVIFIAQPRGFSVHPSFFVGGLWHILCGVDMMKRPMCWGSFVMPCSKSVSRSSDNHRHNENPKHNYPRQKRVRI